MLGFTTFVTIMLGFATLMAYFSMPHDINSTIEVFPTSIGYDNSYSVGNV